jgi:hypothetical protein
LGFTTQKNERLTADTTSIIMSATTTTPAAPDRTPHNAILAALALDTQQEKEEALTTALKSWQDGDGSDSVRYPHLLVHLLDNYYDLLHLPDILEHQGLSDYTVFQKVCAELGFKLLFANVNKVYGCCIYVEHHKIRK